MADSLQLQLPPFCSQKSLGHGTLVIGGVVLYKVIHCLDVLKTSFFSVLVHVRIQKIPPSGPENFFSHQPISQRAIRASPKSNLSQCV